MGLMVHQLSMSSPTMALQFLCQLTQLYSVQAVHVSACGCKKYCGSGDCEYSCDSWYVIIEALGTTTATGYMQLSI